ncbi:MAG: hypothetical protein WKF78_09540 [Candidatus Limnocylindrales bacterium]
MTDDTSIAQAIGDALAAYDALTALGEEIEDEWGYVNDLAAAWRERLETVVASRGGEAMSPASAAALDRLIAEIEAIHDPHRAIDWLSTFPQVALIALGEAP